MKQAFALLVFLHVVLLDGAQGSGWSMTVPTEVTGVVGKPLILPCSFTHPYKNYNGNITVIWKTDRYDGPVIFKCTDYNETDGCRISVNNGNKYKLDGNPRHNNLSLRILHLGENDTNTYFCRVELTTDSHSKYESKTGTQILIPGINPETAWSMKIPPEVTGVIGRSLVLPCSFTHPYRHYNSSITVMWKVETFEGPVIFKCTDHGGSGDCKTTINHGDHYKLIGNPRHNDLSLLITNLTINDSNIFFCRVELTAKPNANYQSANGIRVHVTGTTGNPETAWSMKIPPEVTGVIGRSLVLPCSFSHPYRHYNGSITVMWKVKSFEGPVIFKCTDHDGNGDCKTTINQGNHYKFAGNLQHNDLSLLITNLTINDSNIFFCRVELTAEPHAKYQSSNGILVHVTEMPRIISVTVGSDNHAGYKAVCVAEGIPLPAVTWLDPNHHICSSASRIIHKHQIIQEMHSLAENGKYMCVAENKHGKDTANVFFFGFQPLGNSSYIFLILCSALGIKLLLFVILVGVLIYFRRDDPSETAPQSSSCRKRQESTYENVREQSPQ
ncbi:sialic acid-binding Ig-like lectin 15 isoform X1 [Protopterus annectens]|uniref:sialic acid-binding Ig-like lectin 15 isoform X1 n=1 Tax=Protopterus annectens TaxID=7888 RepID=UPI001CFA5361|nr:sialic acid-binding Ig-like lectin 15 isoform X1 [Protopterus annectens]